MPRIARPPFRVYDPNNPTRPRGYKGGGDYFPFQGGGDQQQPPPQSTQQNWPFPFSMNTPLNSLGFGQQFFTSRFPNAKTIGDVFQQFNQSIPRRRSRRGRNQGG